MIVRAGCRCVDSSLVKRGTARHEWPLCFLFYSLQRSSAPANTYLSFSTAAYARAAAFQPAGQKSMSFAGGLSEWPLSIDNTIPSFLLVVALFIDAISRRFLHFWALFHIYSGATFESLGHEVEGIAIGTQRLESGRKVESVTKRANSERKITNERTKRHSNAEYGVRTTQQQCITFHSALLCRWLSTKFEANKWRHRGIVFQCLDPSLFLVLFPLSRITFMMSLKQFVDFGIAMK